MFRQGFKNHFSIFSTLCASLLVFDDHAPDLKVGDNLQRIDSGCGRFSCGLYQASDPFKQNTNSLIVYINTLRRDSRWTGFLHCNPRFTNFAADCGRIEPLFNFAAGRCKIGNCLYLRPRSLPIIAEAPPPEWLSAGHGVLPSPLRSPPAWPTAPPDRHGLLQLYVGS